MTQTRLMEKTTERMYSRRKARREAREAMSFAFAGSDKWHGPNETGLPPSRYTAPPFRVYGEHLTSLHDNHGVPAFEIVSTFGLTSAGYAAGLAFDVRSYLKSIRRRKKLSRQEMTLQHLFYSLRQIFHPKWRQMASSIGSTNMKYPN
jgi:hypothetical protein